MVQESGTKTNAFSAVSRKETGNVVDMAAKYEIGFWRKSNLVSNFLFLLRLSRKNSQMGMKQFDSTKSHSSAKTDNSSAQKYGAWGPVFKNKDHFASMHLF